MFMERFKYNRSREEICEEIINTLKEKLNEFDNPGKSIKVRCTYDCGVDFERKDNNIVYIKSDSKWYNIFYKISCTTKKPYMFLSIEDFKIEKKVYRELIKSKTGEFEDAIKNIFEEALRRVELVKVHNDNLISTNIYTEMQTISRMWCLFDITNFSLDEYLKFREKTLECMNLYLSTDRYITLKKHEYEDMLDKLKERILNYSDSVLRKSEIIASAYDEYKCKEDAEMVINQNLMEKNKLIDNINRTRLEYEKVAKQLDSLSNVKS